MIDYVAKWRTMLELLEDRALLDVAFEQGDIDKYEFFRRCHDWRMAVDNEFLDATKEHKNV